MRILVADKRSRVRFALRALLGQRPGLAVVGEAADGEELLARAATTQPDLVLLDWALQGPSASDLLAALREHTPDLQIIALSGRSEVRRAALAAGADAFVSKNDPPERLLAALEGCRIKSQGVRT